MSGLVTHRDVFEHAGYECWVEHCPGGCEPIVWVPVTHPQAVSLSSGDCIVVAGADVQFWQDYTRKHLGFFGPYDDEHRDNVAALLLVSSLAEELRRIEDREDRIRKGTIT